MPIFSLMYLSRSALDPLAADRVIDAIVGKSVAWNGQVGITGALIYTGSHFAQVLEGTEAEVRSLMDQIVSDGRHSAVIVVSEQANAKRRFGDWQMAYCGTAVYVQQHIDALLPAETASARPDRVDRLRRLMRELAAAGGVSQR